MDFIVSYPTSIIISIRINLLRRNIQPHQIEKFYSAAESLHACANLQAQTFKHVNVNNSSICALLAFVF